jgi:hypothetical protein
MAAKGQAEAFSLSFDLLTAVCVRSDASLFWVLRQVREQRVIVLLGRRSRLAAGLGRLSLNEGARAARSVDGNGGQAKPSSLNFDFLAAVGVRGRASLLWVAC